MNSQHSISHPSIFTMERKIQRCSIRTKCPAWTWPDPSEAGPKPQQHGIYKSLFCGLIFQPPATLFPRIQGIFHTRFLYCSTGRTNHQLTFVTPASRDRAHESYLRMAPDRHGQLSSYARLLSHRCHQSDDSLLATHGIGRAGQGMV